MHECKFPAIVDFVGAFMNDSGDVIMCMEYMDCGYVKKALADYLGSEFANPFFLIGLLIVSRKVSVLFELMFSGRLHNLFSAG